MPSAPKPTKAPPTGDDSLTFDQAMQQAETLLSQMESGEMELEDSLKAYERGMMLLARCKAVLSQAMQRVEEISAAGSSQAGSLTGGKDA